MGRIEDDGPAALGRVLEHLDGRRGEPAGEGDDHAVVRADAAAGAISTRAPSATLRAKRWVPEKHQTGPAAAAARQAALSSPTPSPSAPNICGVRTSSARSNQVPLRLLRCVALAGPACRAESA